MPGAHEPLSQARLKAPIFTRNRSGLPRGAVWRVGLPGRLRTHDAVVRRDTGDRGGRRGLGRCCGQSGKAQHRRGADRGRVWAPRPAAWPVTASVTSACSLSESHDSESGAGENVAAECFGASTALGARFAGDPAAVNAAGTGNEVGTTSAHDGALRLSSAHLCAASPAEVRKCPGGGDVDAFLGVKGSPVQIRPSRPEDAGQRGSGLMVRGLF
jgi:hypothetical protein